MNTLDLYGGKYKITADGEVISTVGKGKILVGKITKVGYRWVVLHVDGKKIYKQVHRLVAENFIPNPLNLPVVNHKDGNKLNNTVSNLEWVTFKQNSLHARDVLKVNCRINMHQANEIRSLYSTGNYTFEQIGDLYNLCSDHIKNIIKNKRWAIEKDDNSSDLQRCKE